MAKKAAAKAATGGKAEAKAPAAKAAGGAATKAKAEPKGGMKAKGGKS